MTAEAKTRPEESAAEPKRGFRFPTAFTVLFFVLVLIWILTFFITPGSYSYVSCDGGPPTSRSVARWRRPWSPAA